MRRVNSDSKTGRRKRTAYSLLFFFMGSFAVEFAMGTVTGSHALIISGMFLLFGVFISIIILLRDRVASNVMFGAGYDFSLEKLEYIVVAGISLMIAVSAGMLLSEIAHLIFFHRPHPPGLTAAWTAVVMVVANLMVALYLKKDLEDLDESDRKSILFLLIVDAILSMLVILVVLIARAGFFFTDYLFATLEGFFVVVYSIYFLKQSYGGLMNASCDSEFLKVISRFIKKADPLVRIKSLKVSRAGKRYQIMATISLPDKATIADAKITMRKIEGTLRSNFREPHELHVGFFD